MSQPRNRDLAAIAATDPELVETFDNFIKHEVASHGGLGAGQRLLVRLASMIACQTLTPFRSTLAAALEAGLTPVEVKEVVYQSVPYVGMSKSLDFILATNEILTRLRRHPPARRAGHDDRRGPDERSSRSEGDRRSPQRRGHVLRRTRRHGEAQVKGHVAGNLNVGNDRAALLGVITELVPYIGYPRSLNALQALDAVVPAVPRY